MATVHRITFVVVGGKDTLNSLEKAVTDSQREVFGLFPRHFRIHNDKVVSTNHRTRRTTLPPLALLSPLKDVNGLKAL